MDYKEFGKRVRQHRLLNQMTQEELAEKAGVSTSFIGHIERGEKKASLETVVALCNAMSVSPTTLLQESLSTKAIQSQVQMTENTRDMFNDLMQVLREHKMP